MMIFWNFSLSNHPAQKNEKIRFLNSGFKRKNKDLTIKENLFEKFSKKVKSLFFMHNFYKVLKF